MRGGLKSVTESAAGGPVAAEIWKIHDQTHQIFLGEKAREFGIESPVSRTEEAIVG